MLQTRMAIKEAGSYTCRGPGHPEWPPCQPGVSLTWGKRGSCSIIVVGSKASDPWAPCHEESQSGGHGSCAATAVSLGFGQDDSVPLCLLFLLHFFLLSLPLLQFLLHLFLPLLLFLLFLLHLFFHLPLLLLHITSTFPSFYSSSLYPLPLLPPIWILRDYVLLNHTWWRTGENNPLPPGPGLDSPTLTYSWNHLNFPSVLIGLFLLVFLQGEQGMG